MIDINFVRKNPGILDNALRNRSKGPVEAKLLELDEKSRAFQTKLQELQQERNKNSEAFGKAKARGEDVGELQQRTEALKKEIAEITEIANKSKTEFMELLAAIVGLEALKKPCDVELTSDSKYLVDAFNQHWIDGWINKGWKVANKQPVKNKDLWQRLLKAKEPHNVKFIWVKGHAGHEFNERCDQMAVASANSDNLLEDNYL